MSFPLYFDEHVDVFAASLLRQAGIDVQTTQEARRAQQNLPDEDQLQFATANRRAIVTYDSADFADIAMRWALDGRSHTGIIVCRQLDPREIAAGLRVLQEQYPDGIENYYLRLPRQRRAFV